MEVNIKMNMILRNLIVFILILNYFPNSLNAMCCCNHKKEQDSGYIYFELYKQDNKATVILDKNDYKLNMQREKLYKKQNAKYEKLNHNSRTFVKNVKDFLSSGFEDFFGALSICYYTRACNILIDIYDKSHDNDAKCYATKLVILQFCNVMHQLIEKQSCVFNNMDKFYFIKKNNNEIPLIDENLVKYINYGYHENMIPKINSIKTAICKDYIISKKCNNQIIENIKNNKNYILADAMNSCGTHLQMVLDSSLGCTKDPELQNVINNCINSIKLY